MSEDILTAFMFVYNIILLTFFRGLTCNMALRLQSLEDYTTLMGTDQVGLCNYDMRTCLE